jgi:hypothetical protein
MICKLNVTRMSGVRQLVPLRVHRVPGGQRHRGRNGVLLPQLRRQTGLRSRQAEGPQELQPVQKNTFSCLAKPNS